jgi:hypothetical protein
MSNYVKVAIVCANAARIETLYRDFAFLASSSSFFDCVHLYCY